MRHLIFIFLSLSLFSFAELTEASDFEKSAISRDDIYDSIPSLRNIWVESVEFNGVTIFKQKNIFDIDGVAYRDIDFGSNKLKMSGYSIQDYSRSLQEEGFLSNKIRLMAGIAPITKDDNRPLMVCKLENHVDGPYYELSVTQFNTIREAFPSNYDMGHLCVTNQAIGTYWKMRLSDIYDNFGNKK